MTPKNTLPIYTVTLPSDGRKVSVRPFLVKEEKLLFMAIESGDTEDIIKTTIQVIQNCIQDKLDVSKLPFFDVDYLFIALRAKSVGESIDVKFTCNAPLKENPIVICGKEFKAQIDISFCSIVKEDDITPDIGLGNSLSVKMRYPTYAEMKSIKNSKSTLDEKIQLIGVCLDRIIDGENIQTRKDFSTEVNEFIEGLTRNQFNRLERFVDNLPSFIVKTKATCDKCGTVHDIEYDEFESFFV